VTRFNTILYDIRSFGSGLLFRQPCMLYVDYRNSRRITYQSMASRLAEEWRHSTVDVH